MQIFFSSCNIQIGNFMGNIAHLFFKYEQNVQFNVENAHYDKYSNEIS